MSGLLSRSSIQAKSIILVLRGTGDLGLFSVERLDGVNAGGVNAGGVNAEVADLRSDWLPARLAGSMVDARNARPGLSDRATVNPPGDMAGPCRPGVRV
jgi:hypothetical protein